MAAQGECSLVDECFYEDFDEIISEFEDLTAEDEEMKSFTEDVSYFQINNNMKNIVNFPTTL